MSDGLWICDAEPRLLWINRACEELNEIKAADVCGLKVSELLSIGNFDHDATTRVLRQRRPVAINQHVKSGRTLLVNAVPVYGDDGNIAYVVGTERDLTELNQLRDELDQTREITLKISSELLALKLRDARLSDIVANSEALQRVLDTALKLSQFDSTVLLTGPSGTGKSMLAKLIHEQSGRGQQPLLSLNCGALPESLLEAELFGYAGGAFSGAQPGGKPGLVEAADSGTLFLDEIDALPLEVQVKLLTFLDTQSFIRVGDTRLRQVDVRLIAATNKDLLDRVNEGTFRNDLYFRLNVVPVELPPLSQRRDDIPALVRRNLERLNQRYGVEKSIDRDAMELLCRYDFPGNVRELQNILERSFVLADSDVIVADDLPGELRAGTTSTTPTGNGTLAEAIADVEQQILSNACKRLSRQVDIARELGVSQATVARLLRKHGLRTATNRQHRK
jgi:PAS domain S-box-containing protein